MAISPAMEGRSSAIAISPGMERRRTAAYYTNRKMHVAITPTEGAASFTIYSALALQVRNCSIMTPSLQLIYAKYSYSKAQKSQFYIDQTQKLYNIFRVTGPRLTDNVQQVRGMTITLGLAPTKSRKPFSGSGSDTVVIHLNMMCAYQSNEGNS